MTALSLAPIHVKLSSVFVKVTTHIAVILLSV